MKLDYYDLISPLPFQINKVGSIKCPTLKEISEISYYLYAYFVSFLNLSVERYFQSKNPTEEFDVELLTKYTKFDLVLMDEGIAKGIEATLDFFFLEDVTFSKEHEAFLVTKNITEPQTGTDKTILVGAITIDNYNDIIDVIRQRLHLNSKDEIDISKVKNKRGLKRYLESQRRKKKLEESKQQSGESSGMSLPNIISAVAACSPNLNWIDIWDITIYQLFDEFDRLQLKDQYNISSTQVSVWGDKEKRFQFLAWAKDLHNKK